MLNAGDGTLGPWMSGRDMLEDELRTFSGEAAEALLYLRHGMVLLTLVVFAFFLGVWFCLHDGCNPTCLNDCHDCFNLLLQVLLLLAVSMMCCPFSRYCTRLPVVLPPRACI